MTVKYFNVKNGLSVGSIIADASNSNVSANTFIGNLEVTALANLGAIGNVRITGGTSGQAIITDGAGNLTFGNSTSTANPAPMPIVVSEGDTLTIGNNYQGLFGYPLTIDGTLTVDGILIDVNDNGNGGGGGGNGTPGGSSTQLQFNNAGSFGGISTATYSGGKFTLGSNTNVKLTGGSAGQLLSTDGQGNLSWVTSSGGGGSGNVVIDNFTGNGVQTAFALSATPTSENETIVNIDGVVQLHTSYTLSGSTLTLSAAPSNGSLIEISTLNLGGGSNGGGTPGGLDTQVQFNDANSFAGNTGFTFNKTTGTLTAAFFSGAGNALSNIQGANVTGAVSYATTANSVAVANVSGIGNIATANLDGSSSNVLYGNGVFAPASGGGSYGNSNVATFLASYGSNTITTTGNVSVGNIIGNGQALTAITGANVTGAVAYATTANSVAVANVSGIGNIATVNLDGSSSNILYGNGSFAAPASGGMTWNIVSSNVTMSKDNGYFVDTTAGAKTLTLPSSATLGDTVRINDLAGTFGTNNLTVARNGGNIQGVAEDLVVSVNQSSFGLVYSNSTYGWKLLEI